MESSKDEAETIDVSALMLGLDDTDSADADADADEGSDPGSIHLESASTLRIDSLVASDSKYCHESLSALKVSHQHQGRQRPRRSMVYNNPEEYGRQYPPAAQAVIQDECGSMEEGSSSSVLFGDEASLFLSGNSVTAYDENEISPRSVSRRFRFKAGSMGSKHGKRAPDSFQPGTTTSLSGEGETPTSPSTGPYSSTSTSTSTSTSGAGAGAGAGGFLKQWFQRSSREKKHSTSPAGFKSLFRESRPTKSSDQFESLEANANSRAWHSFSNVNPNQQLIRENVLQPKTTATTTATSTSWEEVEKILNDSRLVKMTTLYTTNDRAEADAYEDCNAARAILISLVGTSFDEKSISLHPYHELELKNALNIPMAEVLVVPTLYVGGEYVVGIDNIMQLYKKGELGSLLLRAALPSHGFKRDSLCSCRGGRFLVCSLCKGKGKLSRKGQESMRCRHCSATGLLKCPNCLYS